MTQSAQASTCGSGTADQDRACEPHKRTPLAVESNTSSIECGSAGPLPLPDRTVSSSAVNVGAHVRVLPGGVQRCCPRSGGRLEGWGETVLGRSPAAGDHRGQDQGGPQVAGRGGISGVGAVGRRRTPRLSELLRLQCWSPQRTEDGASSVQVEEGQPAVVPVDPQRVQHQTQRPIVSGEGRGCAGPLVTAAAIAAQFGHDHPGAGRALLRQLCRRGRADTVAHGGAGDRCRPGHHEVGDLCGHHGCPPGHRQPEAPGRQATQAWPAGTGKGTPRQGQQEPGENLSTGRCSARQGSPRSAGLSPQADPRADPRQPSGSRGGSEHHRDGTQPAAGEGDSRCRVGAVRSAVAGKGRAPQPHRHESVPMAALVQNMLGVWACHGGDAAEGPGMDLPRLYHTARPRLQRRTQHSRRRAGGEAKRPWSRSKTSIRGGAK